MLSSSARYTVTRRLPTLASRRLRRCHASSSRHTSLMEVTSSTIPTTSVANSEVPRWHSSFSVSHGNQHDGMENAASAAGSSSHGGSPLNPVPNFDDERAAYESKSNFELLRAAAVFRLSKIPVLVNNAESLLIASRKILGGTLTDFGLKATLFGHFCAGEDELKIRPVLKKLDEVGIGSILDYAAENDGSPEASKVQGIEPAPGSLRRVREYDYEDEAKCDGHVEVFKKCINDVASLGSDKDGFAAIKVTALGNPKLLARMSTAIVEASRLFEQFDHNKDGTVGRDEFETGYNLFFNDGDVMMKEILEEFDPDNTGNVDYLTWSMKLSPRDLPRITAKCREAGPLAAATPTEEEIELIEAMYDRCHTLAQEAANAGTRLLIDAEQVRFQPAIDNLVLDLQQTWNAVDKSDYPIIYNTYQCYLKDARARLENDVERSDRFDFHFGAKLVRGAYMESERELASLVGMASPIHDTIEDTHECYNSAVDYLLQKSLDSTHKIEVMVASHNQRSIELAIEAMNKHQIDRKESTISFAQLYGMQDTLSFNLGKHGYRAYKYVPYGQVHEVMPYLLRRARENSAIVGGAAKELDMTKAELKRRLAPQFAA